MARITDTTALTKLQESRYETYDLVYIDGVFTSPWNGGIYLTNYPVDISLDLAGDSTQVTFLSLGAFLGVSDFTQSSDLEVEGMNISLSGLPGNDVSGDSMFQILLSDTWKGYSVKVWKLIIVDPTDASTSIPIEVFRGTSVNSQVEIDNDGICSVNVTVQDDFAAFETLAGRRNNPSESPEIATKLYKSWPVSPSWQKIGTFNDFSSWTVNGMTGPTTNSSTYLFSPYGYQDSSSFAQTTAATIHYIETPNLGSVTSGQTITFSAMVAGVGDAGLLTQWFDVSLTSTETGLTSGTVFDLSDYTIETAAVDSEYVDQQIVTDNEENNKPVPVENKQPWCAVIVSYTASSNLTNVKFRLTSVDQLTDYDPAGETARGFQICNASAYLEAYNYDYTFKLTDYYDYIPDTMFINAAKTNQQIRWATGV